MLPWHTLAENGKYPHLRGRPKKASENALKKFPRRQTVHKAEREKYKETLDMSARSVLTEEEFMEICRITDDRFGCCFQ